MKPELVYDRVLPYSAAQVWPVVSDTAGMNRKLGLAPMSFTTKDGVRTGKQKSLEWTEEPWEWRQNSWLVNERVYKNGFFKSITGKFAIESLGVTQCRVSLAFRPVYRSNWLAGLFNFFIRRLLKQLMNAIEETVAQNQQAIKQDRTTTTFTHWLGSAHEVDRVKIAPKEVAEETNSQWQKVFKEAVGMKHLAMRFAAVCPHCRGSKQEAIRLTDFPEKMHCDSCEIDFAINTQDSVEVSFRDNTIPAHMIGMDFCSADVVHKPAIICQRRGGTWQEQLLLTPGIYSLKKKGEPRSLVLQVEELALNEELILDDVWKTNLNSTRKIGPRLTLTSKKLPQDGLVMLEQLSRVRGALYLPEILAVPEFVDIIPAESLVTSFAMEMGERSVLFTDVVGSTDMYFKIGDNAAFQKVRESFLLIGEIARKHNGLLVKTIGDATMYAFMNATDALKTALEIQVQNRQRETKLRVTLHHGSCLAVVTRDGQDFFGDTINVCAKFQAMAGANQVAFGKEMRESVGGEVWQQLTQGHSVEEVTFDMKGDPQRSFALYRITV